MAALATQTYTPAEEADMAKWTAAASGLADGSAVLAELNTHLATRTTVLGAKPSAADAALYGALAPLVRAWTPEQRTGQTGLPHVVRFVDFVQNRPDLFGVTVADADKVAVDADEVLFVATPVDAKAEKERLKKEKAAAAAAAAAGGEAKAVPDRTKKPDEAKEPKGAKDTKDTKDAEAAEAAAAPPAGKKKEKKEKQTRPPKAAPAPAAPPSPGLIDLRVGHILKAVKHPEADSLYVSTIAMGDAAGSPDTEEYEGQVVRTVCSGLNGLVPLADMQGRRVVVVCNLKPVKMRGIKSAAMVLAASPRPVPGADADAHDAHAGPVELVSPPADAPAGTPVYFEGWQATPEKQLNPKKKLWETFQPGFTTTDSLEVAFDTTLLPESAAAAAAAAAAAGPAGSAKLVAATGGVCTVATLKGATVR